MKNVQLTEEQQIIADVQRDHEASLMARGNVVGVGVGDDVGEVVGGAVGDVLGIFVGDAVGVITRWHTSTTCDVMLLGFLGQLLLKAAGGTRQILDLGTYNNAELVAGDIATGYVMPFGGSFVSLHGMVEEVVCSRQP